MDNPLLALQVQTPDIAGSFQRGQAGAAEIQTAKLGNMLKSYALQKAQRDEVQQTAQTNYLRQHAAGIISGDPQAVSDYGVATGDVTGAMGYQKSAIDNRDGQIKNALSQADFIGRSASSILAAPPEVRPLLYQRSLQEAKELGMPMVSVPQQYDESTVKGMLAKAVSVKDQITNHLAQQKAAEDARHNRTQEGLTARGQNMTDARSRDSNKNDVWRIMTDAEKKAANLPSQAAYKVNGKNDIQKIAGNTSVRPIPSSALAGIQNNNTAISKIDRAIAALEANPDAVGLKTYAGDTVTQRIDPKGVETRAMVADVGSQQLHDRSGAAVTISEAPRLTPFVPSVHDNAQTAIKKLRNLRKQYESNNEETQAFFSPEAGYMSPPSNGKPGSSGGKQVNTGVVDFNDLPEH
jgi:hypothetical protein